jgi:hypothetical protein
VSAISIDRPPRRAGICRRRSRSRYSNWRSRNAFWPKVAPSRLAPSRLASRKNPPTRLARRRSAFSSRAPRGELSVDWRPGLINDSVAALSSARGAAAATSSTRPPSRRRFALRFSIRLAAPLARRPARRGDRPYFPQQGKSPRHAPRSRFLHMKSHPYCRRRQGRLASERPSEKRRGDAAWRR